MKIITQIQPFLNNKNIELELDINHVLTEKDTKRLFKSFYPKAHSSIIEFYTESCNGFSLSWEADDEIWGGIEFDSLDELKEGYDEFQEHVSFLFDEVLNYTIKPDLRKNALAIMEQMRDWAPLEYEGNGDCTILNLKSGEILFHQHDWFDGFGSLNYCNGAIISDSILKYINSWGEYCFIKPNVYLDDQVLSDSGASFNDQFYDNRFKVKR